MKQKLIKQQIKRYILIRKKRNMNVTQTIKREFTLMTQLRVPKQIFLGDFRYPHVFVCCKNRWKRVKVTEE